MPQSTAEVYWYNLGAQAFPRNLHVKPAYDKIVVSSYPKSDQAYLWFKAGWESRSRQLEGMR